MNRLLMLVLMASVAFAFPGCRSHHHNKKPQRHPPQHQVRPRHKAPPPSAYKKAPPPPASYKKTPAPVRPAPVPNGKVPPPKR